MVYKIYFSDALFFRSDCAMTGQPKEICKSRKTAVLPGFWNIEHGSGGDGASAAAAVVWQSYLPKIYGFIIAVIKIL